MSAGPAVISLATADRWYAASLIALERSLDRVGFTGERRFWRPGAFPEGCPGHYESPFAFKPFCFAAAGESGLRYVLWLDAGCVAIRPIDRIFHDISSRGYVLFRNRAWMVGEWASDAALAAFDLDRETAMELPEVDACAIGLDLFHPVAAEFLARWHAAAREGTAFRGGKDPIQTAADYRAVKSNRDGRCSSDPRVRGHRHDQTVAGILAHRLGMELSTVGLQSYRRDRPPLRPTTMVVNCGAPRVGSSARLLLGRLRGRVVARGRIAHTHPPESQQ